MHVVRLLTSHSRQHPLSPHSGLLRVADAVILTPPYHHFDTFPLDIPKGDRGLAGETLYDTRYEFAYDIIDSPLQQR